MRQYDPPARWSGLNLVLFALNLALILVLVLRFWTGWDHSRGPIPADKNAQPRQVESRGPLQPDELTNINIFEENAPCTVNVTTFTYDQAPLGLVNRKTPRGTGTGFIWNTWKQPDGAEFGRIVTNYHVISPAMRDGKIDPSLIQVTMDDHSVWKGRHVNY